MAALDQLTVEWGGVYSGDWGWESRDFEDAASAVGGEVDDASIMLDFDGAVEFGDHELWLTHLPRLIPAPTMRINRYSLLRQ